MEIRDGGKNPTITLTAEEVMAFLRHKADEAGYADRATCAVDLRVEWPMTDGAVWHGECPSLTIMVSNIKGSR